MKVFKNRINQYYLCYFYTVCSNSKHCLFYDNFPYVGLYRLALIQNITTVNFLQNILFKIGVVLCCTVRTEAV